MPLDFNSTKQFRDFVLSKTLQVPNGPQTFTATNYRIQNSTDFANVDPGAVDTNRTTDLLLIQNTNIFKPLSYLVKENLQTLPRRANLQLYYTGTPYFTARNHTLVGIMTNSNYESESELFKFAASYIRDRNQKGPVYSRIEQNLYKSTVGKVRLIDALNGNLATATNIITGKEPLIENNYSITVAKTLPGKAIDFIQTVAGVEFPWTEIPGDYLSNPSNPVKPRKVANSEFGKILQDATGVLGSFLGIDRKPLVNRNPSDLFIEYMGSGQKQVLFDQLSYSKYSPNYTTTARSQNSSKLFNFIDKAAQGVKNTLGYEAPNSIAYIGDDRGNDVKYAMNDFNDRPVRSTYYLGLLFDKTQTELFQKQRNISEGGQASGKLTWISQNSKNKLGANNKAWQDQRGNFELSLSKDKQFRESSILGVTQDILDSMPTDAGESRSHIANAIDQTARIFREGDTFISKGSAIRYVGKKGEEGVEYCRTWTKDRPYLTYSDTMKKGNNIRKFDASIVSDPWNLNIAPMSNGRKDFDNSSNIFKKENSDSGTPQFYAKKYMFSLENLAWKTSDRAGFTVLDLPFCERGPTGGRIMWFPPYDLKISENNSARWESNEFLGRPEPIYTYKNTERTGQISFKIVVDHPSILNLLVREEFKNLSDEDADNYINAFFSGCQDIDFYDLIRRYATLDEDDIKNILSYLNNKSDKKTITTYKVKIDEVTVDNPEVTSPNSTSAETPPKTVESKTYNLHFDNDIPTNKDAIITPSDYDSLLTQFIGKKDTYKTKLQTHINTLNNAAVIPNVKNDRFLLFGSDKTGTTESLNIVETNFTNLQTNYNNYKTELTTLKEKLGKKLVQSIVIEISSSASSPASIEYNKRLSMRRSFSVLKDFLKKIGATNDIIKDESIPWFKKEIINNQAKSDIDTFKVDFKNISYEYEGEIKIKVTNYGETYLPNNTNPIVECSSKEFKHIRELNIVSPLSYGCRKTEVKFKYVETTEKPTPPNPEPKKVQKQTKSSLVPTTTEVEIKPTKPPIDVMKRIIMKTLSECFYFKKLEENSPLVFTSLREKLKYFHPGFHSTTPEGLNSRLTFLHQCIRPGDTIPIKGKEGELDGLQARNTTFGPPPICILRIGDFYHSKVVIKDMNVTYEDVPWDMNPEGIGFQPMIASVTLSVNFIGGQGLEKPVERLQNALSSNFYANTEMYDERAIITTTTIQGKKYEEFSKEFLEDLQRREIKDTTPDTNKNTSNLEDGIIGVYSGDTKINYKDRIKNAYDSVKNYIDNYEKFYNDIHKNYGTVISTLLYRNEYRTINTFTIYKNNSTTENIELFGNYKEGKDLQKYVFNLKTALNDKILSLNNYSTTNLCEILGIDNIIPEQKINYTNTLLRRIIRDTIIEKLDTLTSVASLNDFLEKRNKMIYHIDKLNFITKYGVDVYIKDNKTYTITLETEFGSFDSNEFYAFYSSFITYLSDNNQLFYEDAYYDDINYDNINITDNTLKIIISEIMSGKTIIDYITDEKKLLQLDENTKNRIEEHFKKFFVSYKEKKFNFTKFFEFPNLVSYDYIKQAAVESNDSQIVEDAKKLVTVPYISKENLNFYKTKSY